MKIKSIVETTTSGSVATVATNMTPGKPLKRAVYGSKQVEGKKKPPAKKLYANSLHEGDDSREKQHDNDWKNTVYNPFPFDRNRAPGQKPDPRSEKYRKMIASKAVKEEGYQDTIQSRYDAQVKKYNATPIGPLDEAEIRENDVVVSPDKGSRTKTGLRSKDKNGILAKFVPPFKATGCWVSDKRGNRMSECETAEIASEVARVLNSEIKNPTAKERDRSSQNAAAAGERLAGGLDENGRKSPVTSHYKLPNKKNGKAEVAIPDADDDDDSWNSDTSSGYDRDELRRQAIMRSVKEGAKVDRMVKHIAKSEKDLGKSKKDAESIAWATANKRGMLDNKNKKPKE